MGKPKGEPNSTCFPKPGRVAGFFAGCVLAAMGATAGTITVPNSSFESPPTTFVDTHIDSWQKAPKPDWYAEGGGFTWDQLTGVFKNTDVTSSDHIDNCDGNQAMWVFAVPQVGVFQDYDSMDWSHLVPPHDFNATFQPGKSYRLTVGLIGGGGGMLEGATLQISLYYRDLASNQVAVASMTVSNTPMVFSNNTHLVDFSTTTLPVKPADPWAGKNMGILIMSTVSSNLEGGYWDVDNLRLSEISPIMLKAPVFTNGHFQFSMQSDPGTKLEILAAPRIDVPSSNWSSVGMVTNTTGTLVFVDPAVGIPARFYQARLVP